MESGAANLSLRPVSLIDFGESVSAVSLPLDRLFLVGRSKDADWPVPDQSVSRRHASIVRKGETWLLTDLKSRHGTSINDRRIEAGVPTPIEDGDDIAFGTWRCRCTAGTPRPGVTTPFAPPVDNVLSVSAIPAQQLGGVAQRGLDVLMELTAKLDSLKTRESVAQAAVESVRRATNCNRVVVVEPESDTELAVIASTSADPPKVSRSLIERAAEQGLVQLTVNPGQGEHAQSIMDLGIRSAICAPVLVDGAPAAFITIDTRDAEGDDLDAARRAQELLSPPERGDHGSVSYRFESIPGRVVAGDLFDIFPLDEHRTAFFLGDVSGKGVGAAMLMAACQSQLRTHLLSGARLCDAMSSVNADLYKRSEASKFITLVAGVVDSDSRTIELADAGHGLCVHVPGQDAPKRVETTPGFPLGVVETADYEVHQVRVHPGSSMVVFSDGAVEQTNPDGHQYGIDGVLTCLTGDLARESSVERLLASVRTHAAGPLADDLTVAAIWIEEGGQHGARSIDPSE
eukprot:g6060.t1